MNVLEKILEELEERVNYRKRLVKYEKKNGTITDVVRNQGALEEHIIVEKIIRSHMDDGKDINAGSKSDWIPCSERLPEKPVFGEDSYIVQTNNIITPFSAFWDGEEWTDVSDDKVKGVIAWQSLPKRYKGK